MTRNLFLLAPLALVACASDAEPYGPSTPEGAELISSERSRLSIDSAPATDVAQQVQSNTDFALDFYRSLTSEHDNIILSPHSITTAFAMTYAGADGDTKAEMASALRFDLPEPALHHAFNALDQTLAARDQPEDGIELNIINQAFSEYDFPWLTTYLDVLAESYGAGVLETALGSDPEAGRALINEWVSSQTRERVEELLPDGSIDSLTVLVLCNAVYFKGSWNIAFDPELTQTESFERLDGSSVDVEMMRQSEMLNYGEGNGWRAIELPYSREELAMVAVLPDDLESFENEVQASTLQEITDSLFPHMTDLELPRFSFGLHTSLKDSLSEMGMPSAFEPARADLSRMDGSRMLYIQDAFHGAFIEVTESGTEAAGSTAVVVGNRSAPIPAEISFDRPFLFYIQDRETGALLFLGRVTNP